MSSHLATLRKEAKRWLKALRAGVEEARERLTRALPDLRRPPTLRDVQQALAREHGLSGWAELKTRLSGEPPRLQYERVAEALVRAYASPDPEAMDVVWRYFGHRRAWPAMRRYIRLDLGRPEQPEPGEADEITLDDARLLVARAQGFADWDELIEYCSSLAARKPGNALRPVAAFKRYEDDGHSGAFRSRDWDEVFDAIPTRRLTALGAMGQMTDALLERVTRLDSLTALRLDGSPGITDAGIALLARMPQLERLDISGCRITDEGLRVLRELPSLKRLEARGTRITDACGAHLAACRTLERLDLSGTTAGDGVIGALAGHERLYDLRPGDRVTDAGLALLRNIPVFRTWRGGKEEMALLSPDARPNFLRLRGAFTDAGFASMREVEGLFALDVDDGRLGITGQALEHLSALPHFSWLAFHAKDESMPAIAALPALRFLMCQDTRASDRGWVALGQSRSIENIWGRRCHGLGEHGFVALSRMPQLRSLSVSCLNVPDGALAALPDFPALEELMPMDVPDAGYRHIGECTRIESLVLMYCRNTGDEATTHITTMPRLRRYFVSYNRITDRTPELLGGIETLEEITIDSCAGVTNRGIVHLARLPCLRRLCLSGMRHVSADVAVAFSPEVDVDHQP